MRYLSTAALVLALVFFTGCTDGLITDSGDDAASSAVAGKKPAPQLSSTISYAFVGTLVDPTHLLAWEGTIEGDINGTILWIFDLTAGKPHFPDQAHVGFYQARWEIYDVAGSLIMAGNSSGSTALPKGKDGIWNGRGEVAEAFGDYAAWAGRHISEGGSVVFTTVPISGDGLFRVN